jgi:hypothetical protein
VQDSADAGKRQWTTDAVNIGREGKRSNDRTEVKGRGNEYGTNVIKAQHFSRILHFSIEFATSVTQENIGRLYSSTFRDITNSFYFPFVHEVSSSA